MIPGDFTGTLPAKNWRALATLFVALSGPAWAARGIPPVPPQFVYDEAHLLPEKAVRTLNLLSAEHERASDGEQIVTAVFQSLEDEDLPSFTNRVFSKWKIGQRGKNNGALIAVYIKDRKIRIEVGYGLEPLLTDALSKRIISRVLAPEIKAGHLDQALVHALLAVLDVIESPLIESGRAQEITQSSGWQKLEPSVLSAPEKAMGPGVLLLIVAGFWILLAVISRAMAREAHFTGRGWRRTRPGEILFGGGWPRHSGGGLFSGGSSGGGFSGGGGSSGGGGASGSW